MTPRRAKTAVLNTGTVGRLLASTTAAGRPVTRDRVAHRPCKPRRLPEACRGLARRAVRAGWRIERTHRHLAWISPAGQRIITPATPGDQRSVRHLTVQLRRAGLATGPARTPRQSRRETT